jgi:hypothetical protein
LYDMWVPLANAVVSVPADPEVTYGDYLRVTDYHGVKEGPYTLLALTPVPGNPLTRVTTPSPQQRQHWPSELRESHRARRLFPTRGVRTFAACRCIHTRRGTGLRPRMRNLLEYRHGKVFVYLSRTHREPRQAVT